MRKSGIGSHTLPNKGHTDDWITPKYILDALGPFDLDPCQSLTQPWPCANKGYTVTDDGLAKRWTGLCYLNPPYSRIQPFMERLAEHGSGIGLLFGRTETKMFREHIWRDAGALLFLAGRLHFYRPDGTRAAGNSGGPSVIVAYGNKAIRRLRECKLPGAFMSQWEYRPGICDDHSPPATP